MKKLLLLLLLLISGHSMATHVVGGEIVYQHIGGSSYILTVKLYRDCDPASVDFPNSTAVHCDRGNGTSYTTFTLPRLGRDTLNPELDTCAFDPGICVEEAIYSSVVSLPPGTQGYHLYYTLCCRNGSIDNINNPLNAQETFYAYVPDNNIYLTNSSPVITGFPPVYVCQGYDLDLDFGATDANGDSLAYSFTPYDGVNGSGITYNAATPPNNFQSSTVTWLAGFGTTDPLDPSPGLLPGLTIDQNGIINGIPTTPGQYVVGVRVDEYRGGVLIGRITRDFQFNVVNCPPPQDAGIGVNDACNGTNITFQNNSGAGANGFWWDFGTGNPADTSVAFEPTFNYGSIGTYTVTLIAQKGTLCADTATYNLTISGLTGDYTYTDTVCVGESNPFADISVSAPNGVVNDWDWDFADGNSSTTQNPSHSWNNPGDYSVELIVGTNVGCYDTVTYDIHVKTPPQAAITPLPGCNDLAINFTNASDANANGFWWNFGTGNPADTSIVNNPSFNYGSYGVYTVTLVAQKGTACADTATYSLTLSTITADFVAEDTTCTNVLVPYTDASYTTGGGVVDVWQWDFDGAGSSTQQNPSIGFTVPGDYDVELKVTSDLGCVDSITIPIHIIDAPIAQIGPTNSCAGLTVNFNNTSQPGANGFWWDFGTGNPADTSILQNPTFTYPGYGAYTVTLIAQKGTACQTSTTLAIQVSDITANFVSADTICEGSVINFTDASVTQVGTTITDWDWDFGDLSVSTAQNPSHQYNGTSGTIPVQLIVESNIGCKDTIVKDIVVLAKPTVNAGLDTAVCVSNPSLQLNGIVTNTTGGTWTGAGGVFTPSSAVLNATYYPSVGELTAGSTYLILTANATAYCAAVKDTIHIQYLSTPTIEAGLPIEVCIDTTYIQLDATVQFSTNTVWTTNGAGSFDDVSLLDATYTFDPGEIVAGDSILFHIETFNFSGCPDDQDSVWLYFNSPPTMSSVFDDTVCAGFPIPLNSNSTTGNGLWTTSGDGTFNLDSSDATLYNHGSIDETNGQVTIYFESLDNGGCPTLYDTLDIVIVPSPDPGFTFIEDCFGNATVFDDTSTSIDPIVSWAWTFETGQTSSVEDPSYTFSTPGIHPVQLIVTSVNGCEDTLVLDVNAHYIPVVNFVIPAPCLFPSSQFYDSSYVTNDTIVAWLWNFGDGNTSTQQDPANVYSTAGTYSVNLAVTSGFGCTNDTTISITIYQGPTANFTAPDYGHVGDLLYFQDSSIANPNPIISWTYDFSDGGFEYAANVQHVFDPEGEYAVSLIVVDDQGCSDTITKIVPVYHGSAIPSAFTPNGDGHNDFLMVLGGNFDPNDFNFKVYNNWGQVIFEATDPNVQGWDGTYKGIDQPIGVYVYTAVVHTYDGEEHILKGDVSLIR